jgi:hypothetical protein
MAIRCNLEGFRLWVERCDPFFQPCNESLFIMGMKGLKAAILPNLGALMALGSLTPFLLEICFQRYAGLDGQMGYDLGDNTLESSPRIETP